MALSAATIFEVRTATGSNNNGGGYVEGAAGTDWSQQAASHANGTNLTVDATTNTKVNPDGYTVATTDVGNIIQITTTGTGGTFTTGFYQITVATTGTTLTQRWTLDRSPAAVTDLGATWAMGGAVASVNTLLASGNLIAGQTIYATGTETRSAAMTAITAAIRISGYGTSRNDGGKYIIQATAGMGTLFSSTANPFLIENVKFDGNSQTITATFVSITGNAGWGNNIEITGVSGSQAVASMFGSYRQLYIHDNSTSGFVFTQTTTNAVFTGQEVEIVNNTSASSAINCAGSTLQFSLDRFIINNNGGDGIKVNVVGSMQCTNGVINASGANGINNIGTATNMNGIALNNVVISNSVSKAIAMTTTTSNLYRTRLANVYQYNSGTASSGTFFGTLGSLSADPFVNASGGNFALSPTSASFSTLANVGFTYPRGTTVDYSSLGAADPKPSVGNGILLF